MITELFYSRIIKINRGSLRKRNFRRINSSPFSDTDELKIALRANFSYFNLEFNAGITERDSCSEQIYTMLRNSTVKYKTIFLLDVVLGVPHTDFFKTLTDGRK